MLFVTGVVGVVGGTVSVKPSSIVSVISGLYCVTIVGVSVRELFSSSVEIASGGIVSVVFGDSVLISVSCVGTETTTCSTLSIGSIESGVDVITVIGFVGSLTVTVVMELVAGIRRVVGVTVSVSISVVFVGVLGNLVPYVGLLLVPPKEGNGLDFVTVVGLFTP